MDKPGQIPVAYNVKCYCGCSKLLTLRNWLCTQQWKIVDSLADFAPVRHSEMREHRVRGPPRATEQPSALRRHYTYCLLSQPNSVTWLLLELHVKT